MYNLIGPLHSVRRLIGSITLGQRKSDNNNRMIQLTEGIMGPALSDYNMWLILLSVIQLSGGHCITSCPSSFVQVIIYS